MSLSFGPSEFQLLVTNYIYQLLDELVLFNLNDCLYFGYSAALNLFHAGEHFLAL